MYPPFISNGEHYFDEKVVRLRKKERVNHKNKEVKRIYLILKNSFLLE